MDDDAGLVTAGLHQGFVHREGTHGRGHIPTVAVVVDASLAHRHLGKGEVDIGLGMGGRADDACFRKRRDTATHAVELACGGVRAAHDGEKNRVPSVAIRRQILLPEDDAVAGAAAHENGAYSLLSHDSVAALRPAMRPKTAPDTSPVPPG